MDRNVNEEKISVNSKNKMAAPESVVIGKNCRFTVLTANLIRMEYSDDAVFNDQLTQIVINRNFTICRFDSVVTDAEIRIETDALILNYKPTKGFTYEGLSVKLKANNEVWHYGDIGNNLGGTVQTLDCVNGSTPLENGLFSYEGYSVIDDSKSYVFKKDGWVSPNDLDNKDIYFFGYGKKYLAGLKDFYRLTGQPPFIPGYALGNWWSRYHKYTQQEYSELLERFNREDIPFSVAMIDMDWHLVDRLKNSDGSDYDGWTGYTWNKELFPDYRDFLNFLKKRNLKTALNLHPHAGVHTYEAQYDAMIKDMHIEDKAGEDIPFDFLNRQFVDSYFKILHNPYEKDGVDFWWIDWQQGNNICFAPNEDGKTNNFNEINPLWMLNHYHYENLSRGENRPLILSRYAGVGSHRYPVGFSGDTITTWETLDFQPYFTATASNIGFGCWSHDICGHAKGTKDDELYARWIQFGVFSPILRLHSTCNIYGGKEPWNYGISACTNAKEFLRLRYRLFPYIYTMNYKYHSESVPLMLPMYYINPDDIPAYNSKNQYWFGSEMTVCPITRKSDGISGMAYSDIWLPEGIWTDFFNGNVYKGGRQFSAYRTLGEMPVFCKAGAIVPMQKHEKGSNQLGNSVNMEILVFPGADNYFLLYEDDMITEGFENGEQVTTQLKLKWRSSPEFTVCAAKGCTKLIPQKRNWKIGFRGFNKDCEFTAGTEFTHSYDNNVKTHYLLFENIDICSEIKISINGRKLINDNSDMMEQINDILLRAQFCEDEKQEIYNRIHQGIFLSHGTPSNSFYWQINDLYIEAGWGTPALNYSVIDGFEAKGSAQGLWGDHLYVDNGYFHDNLVNNRELIVADLSEWISDASLTPVDDGGKNITFDLATTRSLNYLVNGQIFITAGTGKYQVRIIKTAQSIGKGLVRLTVDNPFAVSVNRNSTVTIRATRNKIIYTDSKMYNGNAGFGFFGGYSDVVIDGNEFERVGRQYAYVNTKEDRGWFWSYINNINIYDPFFKQTIGAGDGTGYCEMFLFAKGTGAMHEHLIRNNDMGGNYMQYMIMQKQVKLPLHIILRLIATE